MSGGTTDLDALRRALAENSEAPQGPERAARAAHLLAGAEELGVPRAVIEALGHQVRVLRHDCGPDGVTAPFTRLLRLWDEHPDDFDESESRSLHWAFRWRASAMLGDPDVPLASVEALLGDMGRRYRLAGYSERAVRVAEFELAAHTGDEERAERAYAAWQGAGRDAMADCPACELRVRGAWRAERGRDAEALEEWRPVLEDEFACAHEPHRVLAASLLPLLRLGRTQEARLHHLRGVRLSRPAESLRAAWAAQVEFCALTGNEARGLNLLAARSASLTDTADPLGRLDLLASAALLAGRLTALGHGAERVPGPAGRTWTAGELAGHARAGALALAARFDARNGTARVSERTRARLERAPLADRLPLGVRASRTFPAPANPPGPAAAPGPEALPALLAEARRLTAGLRPHAPEAWEAVARAAEGVGLDPLARAELTDHAAMTSGPEGLPLFGRAAALYLAAGDPGEALAARSRGAYVRALTGRTGAARAEVEEAYDRVLALYAEGATGMRQTAGVLMSRARVLMRAVHGGAPVLGDGAHEAPEATGGPEAAEAAGAAERAVREVLALVGGRTGDDVRLAARAAEAHVMLAELAEQAGDLERATELFRRSVAAYADAGVPWFGVEAGVRAAALCHRLGRVDEAERALRTALEHGGPYLEPVARAQLCLQLAEVTGGRGESAEAAAFALEAAHAADLAGESVTLGGWARHLLGGSLLRQGYCAQAAEVLESALADLSVERHGDGIVVQTRWWLGDCLSELGEHREAAGHRLGAAELARHWPDQQDHATLAHLAGESLGSAGLAEEADRAYARAGELWRAVGNAPFVVRALRARASLAAGEEGRAAEARRLMAEAVDACGRALAEAADPLMHGELTAELGQTHSQFGDLLLRTAPEDPPAREVLTAALEQTERAAGLFGRLGTDGLDHYLGAELASARLEFALGRPAEARARARGVLDACADAGASALPHRQEAARLLAAAPREPGARVTPRR